MPFVIKKQENESIRYVKRQYKKLFVLLKTKQ